MEQARLLIAIALSFLVFLIWNFFFVDHTAVQKEAPLKEAPKAALEKPVEDQTVAPVAEKIPETETVLPATPSTERPPRIITVKTPLYQAQISEKGGVVTSLKLCEYRERVEPDSPLKEIVASEQNGAALRLNFEKNGPSGLGSALFSADLKQDIIEMRQSPKDLKLVWASADGLVVEKQYHFNPHSYLIGLEIRIKNGSDRTISDQLGISIEKTFHESRSAYGFQGPSAIIDKKIERVKLKKIAEKDFFHGNVRWIAVQDRYFLSSIIAREPADGGMRLSINDHKVVENRLLYPLKDLAPGTMRTIDFDVFFGPKSVSLLQKIGFDLDKAVNFGMFDILAKPCLWFMNFVHDHLIPNYGFTIIILTIIIKGILWPLGSKSYKSMAEMKKLQPLMSDIREKYKNDKAKMNQEMMSLYRTYKINPMGGCLPMIVQIPVFFAFYRMLYEAIELRHAPFIFWINDLSAPDRLFHFSFSVPFMQPPYGIPVLTIVMGASMLLQQKMSPPPGDPTQAKMMMLMPIVFTVIFINFSSGLVLYWLVNNLLSIAQQYYITKKRA